MYVNTFFLLLRMIYDTLIIVAILEVGGIEMERGTFFFFSICNALPVVFESNPLPVLEKHTPGFLLYSYTITCLI